MNRISIKKCRFLNVSHISRAFYQIIRRRGSSGLRIFMQFRICWSNYFKENFTSLFMYIRDLETAITQKYSK